jgi:hypothetical protein
MSYMRASKSFIKSPTTIGVCVALEAAVEFWLWCEQQRVPPTWQDIQKRYEVSRATAFRWLAAYRNVREKQEARKAA